MQRSAAERQFSCLFNTISANSFYIWLIFSFYQNNSTCNAIFCLTSCRTRCQVQSAVFKIYSYCTNGLNFAPQLYRNTHANICYSCLSVCHWTSPALSAFAQLAVAKPPRLLDSYGLGAVISLLRPRQNKESPKFKCYHWCMTELTMCLLRATRLKTRAWILLNFLPWSLLELYHLNFINNKIQTCLGTDRLLWRYKTEHMCRPMKLD